MRNIKEPPKVIVLSAEEQAIVADEANQHLLDMEDAGQETERLGDIIIGMADAQVVVSNTPEVGQVEEDLVDAVADMAVAGTDADPTEFSDSIVTSEEGVSTESVSEGIKEALAKIWAAIKAAIAKVWQHVVTFFDKITVVMSATTQRIETLKKVIKKAPMIMSTTKGKMGVFKGPSQLLLIDGRESMNIGKDYQDAQEFAMGVIWAATEAGKDAIKGGVELVSKIVKDPAEVEQDTMMSLGAIEIPMGKLKKAADLGKAQPDGQLVTGHKYLGGLSYQGVLPRWGASGKGTEAGLAGYDAALKLNMVVHRGDNAPEQITLNEKPMYFETILKVSEDWVKKVSDKAKSIRDLANTAHQASQQIDSEIQKLGDGNAEVKKHLSAILSINGKINSMMASLIGKTFNHGTKVANAALDYAIQSCNQVDATPEAATA